MRELAREREAECKRLAAELLADLGRPVTAVDRIAASNLAALHVQANRLEAQGKDASKVRQQITQMMRASFKPDKPAPPPKEDFTEAMLRLAHPAGADR